MTQTFTLHLDDNCALRHHLSTLTSALPTEKRHKLAKMKHLDDAVRSAAASVLVRMLITQHTELSNNAIILHTERYGKPFLPGDHGLYFNASHSGGWVAVSFGRCNNGIDVQQIRKIRGVYPPDAYFEKWVQHEARLKCLGVGILGKISQDIPLFVRCFHPDKYTKLAVCATQEGFAAPKTVPPKALLAFASTAKFP